MKLKKAAPNNPRRMMGASAVPGVATFNGISQPISAGIDALPVRPLARVHRDSMCQGVCAWISRLIFALVVWVVAIARVAQAEILTGPVINFSNDHLYYLLAPTSWTNSEAEAVALGGHLVTINDSSEHDWVIATFGTNNTLWIGLSDAVSEGTFVWASGEPVTYTRWQGGQPDAATADEDYVIIWAQILGAPFAGRWNDFPNVDSQYQSKGVVEVPTQVPANNAFAAATIISGSLGQISGKNLGASLEPGEPATTDGMVCTRSVWFSWVAPVNGSFTFRVVSDFDSQIAVYAGGAVNALVSQGEDDSPGLGGDSVDVNLTQGASYRIRVSSSSVTAGAYTLKWIAQSENTAFTAAKGIDGYSGSESRMIPSAGLPSVWYIWNPPVSGTFTFSLDAGFDTTLGIYTGDSVPSLVLHGENDLRGAGGDTVTLTFTKGITYRVRVGGYSGAGGGFKCNWAWNVNPVYEPLISFSAINSATVGAFPDGVLAKVGDGSLLGGTSGVFTPPSGTPGASGSLFRVWPDGRIATVVEFPISTQGFYLSEITPVGDGTFWAVGRGYSGATSLCRITAEGSITNLGIVPSFGTVVKSTVTGAFYGAAGGGATSNGVIFKLSAAGSYSEVLSFSGNGATNKGANPGPLVEGGDLNFYGTTSAGGANGLGTIFKVSPLGNLQTLVEFTGSGETRGDSPTGPLVQGSDLNFYGTTRSGGVNGMGTIFKMSPGGNMTTLVDFTGNGGINKGRLPRGVIRGSDGDYYGVTDAGGANDAGTIFRMTSVGALQTLYEFTSADIGIKGRLIQGEDGAFYGTTKGEYSNFPTRDPTNLGSLYKISPSGQYQLLTRFGGNNAINQPRRPAGGVAEEESEGAIYGTTSRGGSSACGTVFKIGSEGTVSTVVNFTGITGPFKGQNPVNRLIRGIDGNFYGITERGGAFDAGTIYRFTPAGDFATLIEFSDNGSVDRGREPKWLFLDESDGSFYGVTKKGGDGFGTIFRLGRDQKLSTLVDFTGDFGPHSGRSPNSIIKGPDGNFYGTTGEEVYYEMRYGSVFQMSPEGQLATLANFGSSHGLVVGSDGDLYGTTPFGGMNGRGFAFRVRSDGSITPIVEFPATGVFTTWSGLTVGSDGNFYATTHLTGQQDFGIGGIRRISSNGVLSTVYDFGSGLRIPKDLVLFGDGDLVGVTNGGAANGEDADLGSVYRLVFPGRPRVEMVQSVLQTPASVLLTARINARGASTIVSVEYGADGVTFPSSRALNPALQGYYPETTQCVLTDLPVGQTFFYRVRAENAYGVTLGKVKVFSTPAKPIVELGAVSKLTTAGVQFNGRVNARNFDATVSFEWGTDGDTFPNIVQATPPVVPGNELTDVLANVPALDEGTLYFYRLVATNAGGTAVSGTESFRTLTKPTAFITNAFGESTTSARVFGVVNANRSLTNVVFEYGTNDLDFPNKVSAIQSPFNEQGKQVEALLLNLTQGTTYFYRISATSAGGTGLSASGSFSLGVLSGLNQEPPAAINLLADAQGFLVVNLDPPDLVGRGWRFVGEQQWRASGVTLGGLTTGDRKIEFRPIPGFLHPLREPVVIQNGQVRIVDREYFASEDIQTGTLSITLLPESLGSFAQWRLLGEDDSAWRASGDTFSGLAAGVYLVECREVPGFATPSSRAVTVGVGVGEPVPITYFLEDATVGAQPAAVGFDAINEEESNPYTFVGQLRSDAGSGTGFVVRRRVVATAAHVVFDDSTNCPATGLQWLFQRESGTYEPAPQVPRGSYILSGYSAQRELDDSPGVSSAASQNLDAAAVWFYEEDAGRGGFGGYLASDSLDNEWLLSSRLKTVVGYPLDQIESPNQGRMHATPVMDVTFSHANGRVYLTDDITSRGGNSGGPVCVQYEDGRYFPAAIYLGGTTQTRVRAIDSDVITIFDSAEESSNTGQNSTNGGETLPNNSASVPKSATLTVTLGPQAAVEAGAAWRIGSRAFLPSGGLRAFLSPGSYTLSFKSIPKFKTPAPRKIDVSGTVSMNVNYVALQKPTISGPFTVYAALGLQTSFAIRADDDPTSFTVNGLANTGLTLDPSNGVISGQPATKGRFVLSVVAANEVGSSAPFFITLIIADPGQLTVLADQTRGSVGVSPQRATGAFVQGETVILTAKPNSSNFLFAGWQFEGLDNEPSSRTEAKTSFTMTANVIATANFVPNPFIDLFGKYAGRVATAPGAKLADTGTLSLKLGKLGQFSGKLQLGPDTILFKDHFSPRGTAQVPLHRAGIGDFQLTLMLDLDPSGTEQITGRLSVNGAELDVVLERFVFDGEDRVSPHAGAYTLVFRRPVPQPGVDLPEGYGFGAVTVRRNGGVRFVGKLGDGTPLTQAASVSKTGRWPFHALLHKRQGVITGEFLFRDNLGSDIDGEVCWIKPPLTGGNVTYPMGFTVVSNALGSRYDKTIALDMYPTENEIVFGGGGLSALVQFTLALEPAKRGLLNPNAALRLNVSPANGLLRGSFKSAEGSTLRFHGALLQKTQGGYGLFPGESLLGGGRQNGFLELNAD